MTMVKEEVFMGCNQEIRHRAGEDQAGVTGTENHQGLRAGSWRVLFRFTNKSICHWCEWFDPIVLAQSRHGA
jgi:hypothetical protein